MRILHTADWHLGQMFYQYDRSYEHGLFLDWLLESIAIEKIDVLLVSGDVFDVSNPSASSIKLFYSFLNRAINRFPNLQVVVTAGNHDSGTRLEAPKPLLESSKIHILGIIPKTAEGDINFEKLILPLTNDGGEVRLWCMAVPFLRMGDYPSVDGSQPTYSEGICSFYNRLYEHTLLKKTEDQSIIAMGHLHALDIGNHEADSHDREIMGGVECIPSSAFHEDLSYTALGHIHRAQKVGNKENVRYSGSPVPLSFSEKNYNHQVLIVEYGDALMPQIRSLTVPVTIPLLKIPARPMELSMVLEELTQLEDLGEKNRDMAPYLEVHVHLKGPEPSLRHQIENAIVGKNARLARILSSFGESKVNTDFGSLNSLEKQLSPEGILKRIFQRDACLLPIPMRSFTHQPRPTHILTHRPEPAAHGTANCKARLLR